MNRNYKDTFVGNKDNSVGNEDELSELKLKKITEEARFKKRLEPEKIQQLILSACEIKPLSLNKLAMLLDRNMDNLRVTYISKLVKAGTLRLLYPNEPNHPNQAYWCKIDELVVRTKDG